MLLSFKRIIYIYNWITLFPCHALQAHETDDRRRLQKQQEEDDKRTDILNHIHSDLLTENPAVASSAFGPNRVVPDRWKGMSPEQLEAIRRTQQQQVEEKEVCACR